MVVFDAYDSGIRYFDTAPFYGYGKSEHIVGDVLRMKDGYVLSSKVGRLLRPRRTPQAPPTTGSSRSRSRESSTTPMTASCVPSRIRCNGSG
jgi:aryl-alcohol dehydrogenase-like predicted oxidoreductase